MTDNTERAAIAKDFLYEDETNADLMLYSAIGRIVVLWGMLEYHFSSNVMMLFHNFPHDGNEDRPPGQIRRKSDFWQKSLRRIEDLNYLALPALSWADRMALAANHRDLIIHHNWGNALGSTTISPFRGGGIRARTDGHEITATTLNIDDILNLTEQIDN